MGGESRTSRGGNILSRGESVVLLGAVFLTSICALAYELVIGATGAYIAGDGVRQFAFTIGIFLSSMGFGSFISRQVPTKKALKTFVVSEIAIGLFGGLAHPILYLLYSYTSSYQGAFYFLIILIGTLTGLEIPLITRILSKGSPLRLSISNVLSLDYLGALFTALLFPLILLPSFGLWYSSLFFGLVNLILAGVLIFSIRGTLITFKTLASLGFALLVIIGFQLFGGRIIDLADAAAYGEEIVYSRTTPYQKIVLTRWQNDLRLYLNGNIQFSSFDEYRYHEALIHPLFGALHSRAKVLVLGGGDGLALREIFKYPDIGSVDLVDLDPAVVELARTNPHLRRLNRGSFSDPRVRYHARDAWMFMKENRTKYDAIVVDLPDPSSENLLKLYSRQFYQLLAHGIARDGGIVIQSTSPYFNRRTFWSIVKSVRAAGLRATPLHAHVPSFGEWGYVLAAHHNLLPSASRILVPTRYLDARLLPTLFIFPADIGPMEVDVSTIDHPVILKYYQEDHSLYFGNR